MSDSRVRRRAIAHSQVEKAPRGGETTKWAEPVVVGSCQDGAGLSSPDVTAVGSQPGWNRTGKKHGLPVWVS